MSFWNMCLTCTYSNGEGRLCTHVKIWTCTFATCYILSRLLLMLFSTTGRQPFPFWSQNGGASCAMLPFLRAKGSSRKEEKEEISDKSFLLLWKRHAGNNSAWNAGFWASTVLSLHTPSWAWQIIVLIIWHCHSRQLQLLSRSHTWSAKWRP